MSYKSTYLVLVVGLMAFLGLGNLSAQVTVSIPNGGAFAGELTNAGVIYRSAAASAYDYSRFAYLYDAAELGIPAGATITGLSWYKANNGATVGNAQMQIYLKNSVVTNYTASTAWTTLISGLTPSYNASTAIPATIGYLPFTLGTPFIYTGGNLEIMVDWDISAVPNNPTTAAFTWRYNTVSDRILGVCGSTVAGVATLSTTTNSINTIDNYRPWIQISYTVPAGLNAGLGNFTSPTTPTCPGTTNVTLPLTNFGASNITSATVNWTVNGVPQTPYNFAGSIPGNGGAQSITLGSVTLAANTSYTIVATIVNVNGLGPDTDPSNDVRTLSGIQTGLSGTYTVNSALATGGNNFQSFTDMATALNTYGICGPTVVSVVAGSGPYTNQQISLGQIAGSSPVNTLLINGNNETFTFNSTNTNIRYGIQLNGTDYTTIRLLNIVGTGATASDYNWGIHLTNSADNNLITDNTISVSTAAGATGSNICGIVASGSNTSPTGTGSPSNQTTITRNTINGGYYGIVMVGNGTTSQTLNNQITFNTVNDYYWGGIYIGAQDNAQVTDNVVARPTRTNNSTTIYGIYGTTGNIRCDIARNYVRDPFAGIPTSTSTAYGIYITAADASLGNENVIYNNLVYSFQGYGPLYGIANLGSDFNQIFHNTIDISGTDPAATGLAYGFYQSTTATDVDFRNNMVTVTRQGTGTNVGIFLNTAGSYVVTNYNNIFVTGTNPNIGSFGGTAFPTLALWETANGNVYDQNSTSLNPLYTNPGAGDFTPANGSLNSTGTALPVVTTDINGIVRDPLNPDVGASEFTPAGLDAGIAWISPVPPVGAGSHVITVSITNTQTTTINTVVLNYTDGLLANETQTFGALGLLAGQTVTLSFTVPYNLTSSVTLTGSIVSVNGIADDNAVNNVVTQVLCPSLAGAYTINNLLPTGGLNFASFGEAIAAMTSCGISAPVTFNVNPTSGPYTEQLTIPGTISGMGTHAIVFNGNGRTLQFAPTTNARHVIWLNGADLVTLNNLTIVGTDPTFGFGVRLSNQANNNTITNCTINLSAITSTSSTNSAGIVATGSATTPTQAGNNANNTTVSNNTILGGALGGAYYGICFVGNSPGADCNNNVFEDNFITDFQNNGIRLINTVNSVVDNNILTRPTITLTSTTECIYLTGTTNPGAQISNNRITNIYDGNPASTSTSYGLDISSDGVAGQTIKVFNNVVDLGGNNGTAYPGYLSGTDQVEFVFNTLVADNAASTAGTTRGIYVLGTNTNLTVSNNIVSITRGGTGAKHCIYVGTAPGSWTANRNVYHIAAPAGTNNLGYYLADQATLAAWQTASSQDANSFDLNPVFANPGALNFTPSNATLNNTASTVAFVTTDYNGTARGASPDPGAFEFTPPTDDAGVLAFSYSTCPGAQSIFAVVRNYGITPITSVVVTGTFDGNPLPNSGNTFVVNIAPGATQNVDMGSVTLVSGTTHTLVASTSLPNGTPDANAANDGANQTFVPALSGTFTINSALPTGGGNYQTFNAAANDLNTFGVCGPVVLNVVAGSGPYTEQVTFNAIVGTSAVNTITLNGNGETIQFAPSTTNRHIIRLFGTDYMAINNLTVLGTAVDFGYGIHLYNQANFNTISGCTVNLGAITSTSSLQSAGIVASNSTTSPTTAGNNANNTRVTNTQILGSATGGPYYAIVFAGNTNGADCANNQFTNNTITNFQNNGIRIINSTNTVITGNQLSRPSLAITSTTECIYLTGTSHANAIIANNRISNLYGGNAASTSTSYGIDISSDGVAGQPIKVYNNVISTGGNNGIAYGAYLSGTNFVDFVFNTIVADNAASTAGTTRGVFVLGTTADLNVLNNIVSITRGGTGAKHCIYVSTTPSVWTANRNVYHIAAPAGTNSVGFLTSDRTTIFDWQTASSQDANSQAVDPIFANAGILDFTPSEASINNIASTVAYVTTDYNGVVRGASPDPGAFEFSPNPCQDPPTAGTANSNKAGVCLNESFNLFLTGNTIGNGQSYQWQSSANGTTWANIAMANSASYSTTLTAPTFYRCLVTCGTTVPSTSVQVTLNPFFQCYCTAVHSATCVANHITNVQFQGTTLNNNSACNNGNGQAFTVYPAGPNTTATLGLGQTYVFSVTVFNQSLNQTISLWIDWNRNGTYEASEWTQVSALAANGVPQTINITIPPTAQTGQTGIRIRARQTGNPNGATDACASFGSGESEDYTITIACLPVVGAVYVNDNATGGNNGSTWDNAYTDLQVALANATAGQSIWVAQGTYKPTAGLSRTATFNLKADVSLLGGYPDAPCPQANDRNWVANPTILSGDIGTVGTANDNSYRVVTANNVGNNVTVDGFTIRDAYGNNNGGGVYILANGVAAQSGPDFLNCNFTANYSTGQGAAVGVLATASGSASPSFTDCSFAGNSAVSYGGAIAVIAQTNGTASLSVDDCAFTANTSSRRGGAISNWANGGGSTQVTVDGSSFTGNSGTTGGGVLYNFARSAANATLTLSQDTFATNSGSSGGVLYNHSQGGMAYANISQSVFTGNTATINGGAITQYNELSGGNGTITVEESVFNGNSAPVGGAVYAAVLKSAQGTVQFRRTRFLNNAASTDGGVFSTAVSGTGSSLSVTAINGLFTGNTATNRGGVYYAAGSGGGFSTNTISYSTMYNNSAARGAGMYFNNSGSGSVFGSFRSGIAHQNTTANSASKSFHANGTSAGITVAYSLLDTACAASVIATAGATFSCGVGNLAGDPMFVNAPLGNFQLMAGSPAIDAANPVGAPTVDILGASRPVGAGIDMGAYEFGGIAPRLAQNYTSPVATLFPNPSTGEFALRFAAPANGLVQVFDLNGACLLTQPLNEATQVSLTLDRYPSGLYLVRVVNGTEVFTLQAVLSKP